MQNNFKFKVLSRDKKTKARAGEYKTEHGLIKTPAFVPVGTQATVKGLTPEDLKEIGVQILFGNTYHLHLRPGEDLVKEFGGLSKFMNWNGPASNRSSLGGPTMTDSGGFQVFSLGKKNWESLRSSHAKTPRDSKLNLEAMVFADEDQTKLRVKVTEEGVQFRSHIDGSLHEFTPEKSIEIQKKLGADMILAFDECAPHPSTIEYTKEAMERTHEWAIRSLAAHKSEIRNPKSETNPNDQNPNKKKVSSFGYYSWQQALYGIVQGGVFKDLRIESAKFISNLDFNAIAIGGVAVGESKKEMRDVLSWVTPYLPEEKPRHLLGVGEIDDIFEAVEQGMDTFDCVIPTRFGRYGIIFVGPEESEEKGRFRIDIGKSKYAKEKGPLSKDCSCKVCKEFTRGYTHHLFRANELLAYRLASYHNMFFVVNLTNKIRDAILEGNFAEMKNKWFK
ncbi:MAG: tRNA guanosine(34) transglycosylase Tgt [bacterium]|nr:tRNA guanosine(34) transglycosylase Tgt [bacterium]